METPRCISLYYGRIIPFAPIQYHREYRWECFLIKRLANTPTIAQIFSHQNYVFLLAFCLCRICENNLRTWYYVINTIHLSIQSFQSSYNHNNHVPLSPIRILWCISNYLFLSYGKLAHLTNGLWEIGICYYYMLVKAFYQHQRNSMTISILNEINTTWFMWLN